MNVNSAEYRPSRSIPISSSGSVSSPSPSPQGSTNSTSLPTSSSSSSASKQPNKNQRNQNQRNQVQRSQTEVQPRSSPSNNQRNNPQNQNHRHQTNIPRNRSHSESNDYPSRNRKNSEDSDESIPEVSLGYGKKDKHGRSLNHLLNFTYSERRSEGARRLTKKYQPYNKERYVHATFRFVVKPIDTYQGNLFDPDVLVEWDHIEQVIIPLNQDLSCPICLDEPVVPRITRCGHVYCLVCIRKYIELGERSWRRCPICFDAVSINELRSAKLVKSKNYTEGDTIRLRLLKKEKETNVASPRKFWTKDVIKKPPSTKETISSRFSKISIGSLDYLTDLYKHEIQKLEEQLSEAINFQEHDTVPFIQMAISAEKVKLASMPIDELSKMSSYSTEENDSHDSKVFVLTISEENTDKNAESAFSDDEVESEQNSNSAPVPASVSNDTEDVKQEETQRKKSNALANEDSYYMYQSDDGQLIFAHPLMIHIIMEEFGSVSKLPELIEAKILEIEEHSQNEDTRRKYKPFGHLPSSCEFNLCEIDLKKIISKRIYRKYERELKLREEKRRAKAIREEKMSKKNKDSVNDLERYLRHFDNYNQSFPKPEESLNLNSFPSVNPAQDNPTVSTDSTETSTSPATIIQSPEPSVSYSAAASNRRSEASVFSKDDFSSTLKDSKTQKPSKVVTPKVITPQAPSSSSSSSWGPQSNRIPLTSNFSSSSSNKSTSQTKKASTPTVTSSSSVIEDADYDYDHDYGIYETSEKGEESLSQIQSYTVGKKKKKTVLMSAGGMRRY